MEDKRVKVDTKKVDTKEFEFPETVFVRDIENKVFQGIVLQCLAQIEGISLTEGNFIDSILGRGAGESVKGINAEQDQRNKTINIKVEVNICYGLPIPEKAEEIQSKIAEEVTKLTGLHVASVHVIFKNVIPGDKTRHMISQLPPSVELSLKNSRSIEEDYTDEF